MKIKFNKIAKGKIFCEEYQGLSENNEIEFDRNKVVIIYGPNGTGKTSLAKVLAKEGQSEYNIDIDGVCHTESQEQFAHVISDQNDRNIIQGSTEDFILGDNIKLEYELKKQIEAEFKSLFESKLSSALKSDFGISTIKSPFDEVFTDKIILGFISDLANSKSKGKKIDRKAFINYSSNETSPDVAEYDIAKFKFFVEDYKGKESAIRIFLGQIFSLDSEEKLLLKIEENDEAVKILTKFHYLKECIVCDHKIIPSEVLEKKKTQQQSTRDSLGEKTKKIISGILDKLPASDPFRISETLRTALLTGDSTPIAAVKTEIEKFLTIYPAVVKKYIIDSVCATGLIAAWSKYESLSKEKPKFENEDVIFIEKFLNDCLDRKISLSRDENNNLKLLLGENEFLNFDRKELSLSNGEQNFLSLAFELLKAQKVSKTLVVLDDPISSFDSIYKNKIAYAILKLLADKKSIILTHNTDLIKLLEHQHQKCFKLYFLNNTAGEENGFIKINESEAEILLYIPKFLELLRKNIKDEIVDELTFLISIAPFLRGCAQVFSLKEQKDALTKVMHGYEKAKVNLTDIYEKVIGPGVIMGDHIVSAEDIAKLNCDNPIAIRKEKFPLLHKTLSHTFTYLYLRLNTEKALVEKYSIDTNDFDMLSNIITASFRGKSEDALNNRAFFLSRKTLLNEFNHFEMDMNIFQPAIDITNQALAREKSQILDKLAALVSPPESQST